MMIVPWAYPEFIAHRCGGALAPENTLAGLAVAARLGYRAVEFDAMLSADGVPVIIHDETLERTTDGVGEVALMTVAELRRLDAGVRHHRAFASEPLPTLVEVLAACLRLELAANIEIKPAMGTEAETGRRVAECVRLFLQTNAVAPALLFSSFSEIALAAARAVLPEVPCALLVETVPSDWRARMKAQGCVALHCAARELSPGRAAEIVAAGVPLVCYTVNAPDDAVRLFSLGVTAVFTDRLDLFSPG